MPRTIIRTATNQADWLHLQNASDAIEVLTGAGDDGVFGSAFADLIRGGDGNDLLWGEAGADTLTGDAGNDQLWAGAGADSLDGGAGNDLMWGGAGDDTMNLGEGNDMAWGEDGADRFVTGGGHDSVWGGQGNDSVDGGAGDDALYGDAGDDTILAGEGRNTVVGGEGQDRITAGAGDDSIVGDAGNDTVAAGNGNNTVWAGQGADSITSGTGNDTIGADEGNDTVLAGAGNDVVWANGGNDYVDLDAGNDLASGDMGADTILAGAGHDTVHGGEGDDLIAAGAGADQVFADGGNDRVVMDVAGARGDVYDGGAGVDTLVFSLTRADWMGAGFQGDLARFLSHSASTPWADFRFAAQSLTVRSFEAAAVTVDGVALTAADDSVVAVADRFTVSEDLASLAGNVTANDSVADLVAAVRLVTAASGGSLVLGADGAFNWAGGDAFQALRAGQSAEVTFSYRVTDADGDTGMAVATITILGANDAATIGGETEGTIRAGVEEKIGGRLSITDLDAGEAVFAGAKTLEGRYGHFDFDAKTGDWTYVLDMPADKLREIAKGEALVETLVVVSADGGTTQEVTVTIEAAREKGANLLVNGSFEEPAIKDGAWSPVKEMAGWTSNAGAIEVWAGYGGLKASDGRQHIEIDYDRAVDAISQEIDVEAGEKYVLTFDARGRTDKPATEGFVVMWNEEKLAFIQPTTKEWTSYEFIVEGRKGMDILAFVEDASGNDSYGGLLDNVALRDAVW